MDGFVTPPAPALFRLDADQLERMVHAGVFVPDTPRLELRDGLLFRMSPQYAPHGIAKNDLAGAIRDALRAAGGALRVDTEISVRLNDHDVPLPDIIVWNRVETRGAIPADRVRLLVEIADTTLADDLGRKRALYAAAGIPEYWVVDLPGRAIHQAWAPTEGAYAEAAVTGFGASIRVATMAGIMVPGTVLA